MCTGILAVGILSCERACVLDAEARHDWTVNVQHTNTMFVVQHAQMLVVRKEGKAHSQYNSFRSAFELMEAVGSEPSERFSEMADDLPPLKMLEKRMMMQHKTLLTEIHEVKDENSQLKSKISQLEAENSRLEARLTAENSQLEARLTAENSDLRSRLEKLEHRT